MATVLLAASMLLLVVALGLALARVGVQPRFRLTAGHFFAVGVALALGLVAVGWLPRPDEAEVQDAIRRRLAADLAATQLTSLRRRAMSLPDAETTRRWQEERRRILAARVEVRSVRRRWVHELVGAGSEFEVDADLVTAEGTRTGDCWFIEPFRDGTLEALGPLPAHGCRGF